MILFLNVYQLKHCVLFVAYLPALRHIFKVFFVPELSITSQLYDTDPFTRVRWVLSSFFLNLGLALNQQWSCLCICNWSSVYVETVLHICGIIFIECDLISFNIVCVAEAVSPEATKVSGSRSHCTFSQYYVMHEQWNVSLWLRYTAILWRLIYGWLFFSPIY